MAEKERKKFCKSLERKKDFQNRDSEMKKKVEYLVIIVSKVGVLCVRSPRGPN